MSLYNIAHTLQRRTPWLWTAIEGVNSLLFALRAGRYLKHLDKGCTCNVRIVSEADAPALAHFFAQQPQECFRWFRPHAFDVETLRRLLRRKSFIAFVREEQGQIIGYGFLRCFFHGRCYLGKMVDYRHYGKNIALGLCATGMYITSDMGMRMFETVNKDNPASLRASQKACRVKVVKELDGGDLLIEDFLKYP